MYSVFLEGLEFYGFHGVPDAEQTVGHRYIADILMEVDGNCDESDSVEDSVDYAAVGAVVVALGESTRFRTLERLAAEMANEILQQFVHASGVTIKLAKRLPPAPLIAEVAGVEYTLARE